MGGKRQMHPASGTSRARLWQILSCLSTQVIVSLAVKLLPFLTHYLRGLRTPNREDGNCSRLLTGSLVTKPFEAWAISPTQFLDSQGEFLRPLGNMELESVKSINPRVHALAHVENPNHKWSSIGSLCPNGWGLLGILGLRGHNDSQPRYPSPLCVGSTRGRGNGFAPSLQEGLGSRGLRLLSLPLFLLLSLTFSLMAWHLSSLGIFISPLPVGLPMASKIWSAQSGWIDGATPSQSKPIEETPAPITPEEEITMRAYKINREWAKWGLFSGHKIAQGVKGWYETGDKVIYRLLGGERRYIATTGKRYYLFPNEEFQEVLDKHATEHGFKRYVDDRFSFDSKTGNARYLTYLPQDEHNGTYFIRGEGQANGQGKDYVRLGFSARNSIDGTVSFGFDSFTFRGLCWNGNIMGREGQSRFSSKHVASLKDVINTLQGRIEEVLSQGETVIGFYKALTSLKLSIKDAQTIANTFLPAKYLPFETEMKEGKRLVVVDNGKLVLEQKAPSDVDKGDSLYDIFQNINGRIWHGERADMESKAQYMDFTNQVFSALIPAPQTGPTP